MTTEADLARSLSHAQATLKVTIEQRTRINSRLDCAEAFIELIRMLATDHAITDLPILPNQLKRLINEYDDARRAL